jgi:hypothetical protein
VFGIARVTAQRQHDRSEIALQGRERLGGRRVRRPALDVGDRALEL